MSGPWMTPLEAHEVLRAFFSQAAPGGGGGMGQTVFLILMMVGIFYFLLWRPQSKQAKEHKSMLSALKKGDVVVTNGGIIGRVHAVAEKYLILEAGPNVRFRVLQSAVSGKAPEGMMSDDLKAADDKDKDRK